MRRGFVVGVLVFGFVAATACAAYARLEAAASWPTTIKVWLLLFGGFSLFPLGLGYAHGTADVSLWLFRNRDAPKEKPRR